MEQSGFYHRDLIDVWFKLAGRVSDDGYQVSILKSYDFQIMGGIRYLAV